MIPLLAIRRLPDQLLRTSRLATREILLAMARHREPDRGDRPAGWRSDARISQVRVTVVPDPAPAGHALLKRLAPNRVGTPARLIACLAVALAAVGVIVVRAQQRGRAGTPHAVPVTQSNSAGRAGVAVAYQYPFRCLSVTISAIDPSYARAELDRASPCWRYGAYSIAVFHRVHGRWRTVLDTTSYSCPVASLPAAVQAQLGVCPRNVTRSSFQALRIQQIDTPFSEAP